jgi:hypothetical protein
VISGRKTIPCPGALKILVAGRVFLPTEGDFKDAEPAIRKIIRLARPL